ncbi:hypothetical protein MSPP1_002338 [Malassezia sp. CBS 17886]|nr:hypothetical protein MSPP1_002338 [Malassezia sp. CBS 17886]
MSIWRETKGYAFHSLCLHVKDIEESVLFYQEVFGMEILREAEIGSLLKVWLTFPSSKNLGSFGHAKGLIEFVQQKYVPRLQRFFVLTDARGTESDENFKVKADEGGFHHICFSVPDMLNTRHRLAHLDVPTVDIGTIKNDIIVVKDPDGYAIQLLSQDFDKLAELEEACRAVVVAGAQQSMRDLNQSNDPETMAEAGMKHRKQGKRKDTSLSEHR